MCDPIKDHRPSDWLSPSDTCTLYIFWMGLYAYFACIQQGPSKGFNPLVYRYCTRRRKAAAPFVVHWSARVVTAGTRTTIPDSMYGAAEAHADSYAQVHTPLSSPSTPAAPGTCRISAGQGGHLQGALGEITAGHLGVIKVHQSGKVVLHLGDSQYTLSPGVRCGFAQQVVSVHHGPAPDLGGLGAAAKPSADDPLPTPAAAMDVEGEGGAGSGAAAGMAEEEPKSYTVLGPITKRCVGMPVMDAE